MGADLDEGGEGGLAPLTGAKKSEDDGLKEKIRKYDTPSCHDMHCAISLVYSLLDIILLGIVFITYHHRMTV